MILERENAKSHLDPSPARIALELKRLNGYGKSSFAYLTADDGSYVQVAGGNVACALEWRDAAGRQYRAWQLVPKVPFPDGTPLQYSGGGITLQQREWFFIEQVTEVFVAFRESRPWPEFVHWRDVTEELAQWLK